MEIKTIVRVAQGIEITDDLKKKLAQRYGNIEVTHYPKIVDEKESYQQRINSFHEAVEFILESLPLPDDKKGAEAEILNHFQWLKNKTILKPNQTTAQYQDVLYLYKEALLKALNEYWGFNSKSQKHTVEILNKAEQYVIMSKGRPNLVTLSEIKAYSEDRYVLQEDIQLAPCTDETLQELAQIKQSEIVFAPDWFKRLDDKTTAQIFLHSLAKDATYVTLKDAVNTWLHKMKTVSKTYADVIGENLQTIKDDNKALFPKWFCDWSPAEQAGLKEMLRLNVSNIEEAIKDISKLIDEWTTNNDHSKLSELQDLQELPFWYLKLADHEQLMLKAVLDKHDKIEDAVSFIPSRLRELPGLPNFGYHDLIIVDKQLQTCEQFPPQFRSSHLVPRDEIDKPGDIMSLHSVRNLQKIIESAGDKDKINIQTLISPLWVLSPSFPDYALDRQRKKAIKNGSSQWVDKTFFSTNHPLNYARYYDYTPSGNESCNLLLAASKRHLETQLTTCLKSNPQLHKISSQTLNFIEKTKVNDWAAYTKLNALIKKISPALKNCSLEDIQLLISQAVEARPASRFVSSQKNRDENPLSRAKQELIDYFANNRTELSQVDALNDFMASRCFFENNASTAEKAFVEKMADLDFLSSCYEQTLKSGYGTATVFDVNGRELCLASLENLLNLQMDGLSYGSCVSGKDRKAVEILHTDAIRLFREKFGFWPRFNVNDPKRADFVAIFAELYATHHAHIHAGQNAPGSDGIKTPATYLPNDICEKICSLLGPNALSGDDRRASNNELKYVNKGTSAVSSKNTEETVDAVAAGRLSELNRQNLLNQLTLLLKNDNLWYKKYTIKVFGHSCTIIDKIGGVPQGISMLKKVVLNKNFEGDLKSLVAKIYHISEERRVLPSARTDNMTALYHCLHMLYASEKPDEIFDAQLKTLQGTIQGTVTPSSSTKELSTDNMQMLVNTLSLLLKNDDLWHPKVSFLNLTDKLSGRRPVGIPLLQEVVLSNKPGVDLKRLVDDIFSIVETRRAVPSSRTGNMKTLYDCLHDLYEHPEPNVIFETQLQKLKGIMNSNTSRCESSASLVV